MTNRAITFHVVSPEDAIVKLFAIDEPGPGGANHVYRVETDDDVWESLQFQKGPIKEVGVNGITNEILLAVVIDRLRAFQAGPFACDENASALAYAEHSLHWHQARTHRRIAQQIEGTSKPDGDAAVADVAVADKSTPSGSLHNIPEVAEDGISTRLPQFQDDGGDGTDSVDPASGA